MKIERTELLETLRLVKPALSDAKNQVVELAHIWFDGEYASAFDDIIGVKVECKTDFTGGVLGDKLLGILENTTTKEVTVEKADDGNMRLNAGPTRVKLALLPIEDWFWKPELPDYTPAPLSEDFIKGVKLTLLSVGSGKMLNPVQRGVTVLQKNKETVGLYSTDAVSISHIDIVVGDYMWSSTEIDDRCIVPTLFCEQLVNLAAGAEAYFDSSSVYVTSKVDIGDKETKKSLDYLLFARLVDSEGENMPFEQSIEDHIGDNKSVELPDRLRMALDRALVVLEEGKPVELEVEEDNLYVFGDSPYGQVDDQIKLSSKEHRKVKTTFDPKLIRRGLEDRESMFITRDCLVMIGPKGFYYIVASKE